MVSSWKYTSHGIFLNISKGQEFPSLDSQHRILTGVLPRAKYKIGDHQVYHMEKADWERCAWAMRKRSWDVSLINDPMSLGRIVRLEETAYDPRYVSISPSIYPWLWRPWKLAEHADAGAKGKRANCGQIWGVIAQRNTAVNLDVQEYAQILVVLSGTDPIYTNPPAAPTRQESGTSWIRVDPVDSLFSVVQTQFQF